MPIVDQDYFRYHREIAYFDRIKKQYAHLQQDNPAFSGLLAQDIANFYHLLSSALRIDAHPHVQAIVESLREKYGTDLPVSVFQFQSRMPRSMASHRTFYEKGVARYELVVLVSQHFFNYFNSREQAAILSHELCHQVLGHLDIPAKQLLRDNIALGVDVAFRVDLLKWSLCAEISSDLYALRGIDYDPKVFSTMLIKEYSGITALESDDLISILLQQYEDLASSVETAELTAHPILPLRIKILDEMRKTRLLNHAGTDQPEDQLQEMYAEMNDMIDSLVISVYPELFEERVGKHDPIYLKAAVAVSLIDGDLSPSEIEIIARRFGRDEHSHHFIQDIQARCREHKAVVVANEFMNEVINEAEERQMSRGDAVPLLKYMLYIAGEESVQLEELQIIYRFARHFNVSKEELVLLMHHVRRTN